MQLSNRVTLPKNTPHNTDYVACSAFPGNGIVGKVEAEPSSSIPGRAAEPLADPELARLPHEGETSPALLPEPPKTVLDPAEKRLANRQRQKVDAWNSSSYL